MVFIAKIVRPSLWWFHMVRNYSAPCTYILEFKGLIHIIICGIKDYFMLYFPKENKAYSFFYTKVILFIDTTFQNT